MFPRTLNHTIFKRACVPDIVTPAAGRHLTGVPATLKSTSAPVRGLTYLATDKAPQRQWMMEMGETDDPSCVCDGWTPQNALIVGKYPRLHVMFGLLPKQAKQPKWQGIQNRPIDKTDEGYKRWIIACI